MIESSVLSEPIEACVIDLVGPLPKAKGGCRYLLVLQHSSQRQYRSAPSQPKQLPAELSRSSHFIQRASEASEADSQSCSIEISDIQSNLSTTAKHGDKRVGLCREFDLISEFFR